MVILEMKNECGISREEIDIPDEWKSIFYEMQDDIRDIWVKLKPWRLYKIKKTGQRAKIVSFNECEDGSISISVFIMGLTRGNLIERFEVFGISIDDLEPWEGNIGSRPCDDYEIVVYDGDF